MAAQLEEIECIYRGEKRRFDECLIGTVELVGEARKSTRMVSMTIKGDSDPGEMTPGLRYRLYGRFTNYYNKYFRREEKQFHFQTAVPAVSHDREGIIEYLFQAGKGLGIGRVTAGNLFDRFGSNTIQKVRSNPLVIQEINSRVSSEQCRLIGDLLENQRKTEDATIELTALLANRGMPKTTARKAIKKWGNKAAQVVRKNPYLLMNFRGCGFKTCDKLWIELGLPRDAMRRQALCAWHFISSNSDGHVWFPAHLAEKAIRQAIGRSSSPKRAIDLACRLHRRFPGHFGGLAMVKTDGAKGPISHAGSFEWIAEGKKSDAEMSVAASIGQSIKDSLPTDITEFDDVKLTWEEAESFIQCHRCGRPLKADAVHVWNGKPFGPTCIKSISDGTDVETVALKEWVSRQPAKVRTAIQTIPSRRVRMPSFSLWPEVDEIKGIDQHQRDCLSKALLSRICMLGGSPGTGKTYATAQLIKTMLASGRCGPTDIAIAAPTGKAAVRITEAMQAAGVQMKARTWHSLLGVSTTDTESNGWSFLHNKSNPWDFRAVIGDEESMKDISLMSAVLEAIPRSCHFLMVGDVHQLPPVGAGAPLRDLIASQAIGYGELTEIKRNSGGIVEACAAIRDGNKWGEADNLKIHESGSPSRQMEKILDTIRRAQLEGLDPVWDCQTLVAVNDKSPLGRKQVNQFLQAELNPNGQIKGSPFRLDDKVVCLQNSRFTAMEADEESRASGTGDEVYVANGELGRILEVEPKYLVVRLDSPYRIIRVPRGKPSDGSSSGCSWDLAYALSVHKSQGSEWPIAIPVIDDYPGAKRVCSREWLYTAISRARQRCELIGSKATADSMCRRIAIANRKTFLREQTQHLASMIRLEQALAC